MMKSMTILSSLLTAFLLLSSCEEKENTTPETPTETNYDLLEFEGKAEPLDCGRNLVKRFIEIPQSNWGRIDAGKQPSSFVTYPDVCAYLGAFWFLEAAIENADLTGDEENTGCQHDPAPPGQMPHYHVLWRMGSGEDNDGERTDPPSVRI